MKVRADQKRHMVSAVALKALQDVVSLCLPKHSDAYRKWFDAHNAEIQTDHDWSVLQATFLLRGVYDYVAAEQVKEKALEIANKRKRK